jgi:hypothetical protein
MKIRLIVLAILLVGGWYLASPWYSMWRIVSAAEDGDSAALEERVDFPRLREGMKADLAASRDDGDTDLLDRIGDGIVETVGGAAIDTMITPGGLAVMLDASPAMPGQDLSWSVDYDGPGGFRGVSTYEDGTPGPQMVFERDGLGWQLVAVRL